MGSLGGRVRVAGMIDISGPHLLPVFRVTVTCQVSCHHQLVSERNLLAFTVTDQ